jgi:hypothetical protein
MARSINRLRAGIVAAALPLFMSATSAQEQVQPKVAFYDVQMSKDDIYSYKNLKFTGDYFSFESPSGFLALGNTEVGVTIVTLIGAGTMNIETLEPFQEKIKTAFSTYPLKMPFKSIYMRLNPKEYAETIGKLELVKSGSEENLAKAKEIYDQKFLASYHAGQKALIPNYRTRRMEFDTDTGWIVYDEGYWLTLFRASPYTKIYPSNTINPKQK